jgi:hypothetical protein
MLSCFVLLHSNLSCAGLQDLMCSHIIAQQGLRVGSTVACRTDNSNATDALSYDLAVVKLADSSIGYRQAGWGWHGTESRTKAESSVRATPVS